MLTEQSSAEIGVVGLGVMGRNLAYNLAGKGFRTAGYDLRAETVASAMKNAKELPFTGYGELETFCKSLKTPRKVILMVPAGSPVDSAIQGLLGNLMPGDLIIDCGNSFYRDTIRREAYLKEKGILFLGTGVSGGEEGALHGPSIMCGGAREAYELVKEPLNAIAAKKDGESCCAYMGPGGSGHFVKMVHNGIEYADMQLIAESYSILRNLLGLTPDEIADIFEGWNKGELNSYLIEITVKVLRKKDDDGKPLIDAVLDAAGQKGTGAWTGEEALSLGVAAPSLAEAVFARSLSAVKSERLEASGALPACAGKFEGGRAEWIDRIGKALYAFKICVYAQGFDLLSKASDSFGWGLDLSEAAKIWRGGCIIRAQFLNRITDFYKKGSGNLLLDRYFLNAVSEGLPACRRLIAQAVLAGVPLPCFSSALAYYDGYRSAVLPANLIQLQRDYFGAHTYRRTDKEGIFHTNWEESGN